MTEPRPAGCRIVPGRGKEQGGNAEGGPVERNVPLLTSIPLMDLVELPDGICLYCNLPGTTPDDVSVTVDGEFLHVRAESFPPPIRGKIHALEFSDIVYEGKVRLPAVDAGGLEASLANGLLRVFMPFPPKTPGVRIPVVPE